MKKEEVSKKVILTGGHAATTALAVVEELIRRNAGSVGPKWDIYWVGSKKAYEGKKYMTLETEIFPKMGIKNIDIVAGRLQKKFTIWTIPSIAKLPLGLVNAYKIVRKIKPDIVLSFGGYTAYPVVLSSYLMKIPVIIHDQTMGIGRSNKLSVPYAAKVALARESSMKYLPIEKCVVVGNPLMTQIAEIQPKVKKNSIPVIYVTGGSRGSESLNNLLFPIIDELLDRFVLIHQTGPISLRKAIEVKNKLSKTKRDKYEVYERIDPLQVDNIYRRADIIIARAGANTVSEIVSTKRPAILIPLPISDINDQPANAKWAQDFGIAHVLEQNKTTPVMLKNKIHEIDKNWDNIVKLVKNKKGDDINASKKLVDLLTDELL